jgi:hypothetical protein
MSVNNIIEEGATTKPFVLWRVGSPYQFVAAGARADTFVEIFGVRKHSDRRNQITRNGASISRKLGLPVAPGLGHDLTILH